MINGEFRPGIVHRLDKETSGLILIAKNDRSLHYLQEQFKNRQVEKNYLALVDGHPPTPVGRVEHPSEGIPGTKENGGCGTRAWTGSCNRISDVEDFKNHAYLGINPLTGRTHQIRVHMRFLGCPVTGDTVYGLKKAISVTLKRHFLHAARLVIRLPERTNRRIFQPDFLLNCRIS